MDGVMEFEGIFGFFMGVFTEPFSCGVNHAPQGGRECDV